MKRFRLDRELTLHLVSPLQRNTGERQATPLLMYHSISAPAASARHPYFETATTASRFASHLHWLHEHGYRTLPLRELEESSPSLAPREVVLTFDDGFRDFFDCAADLLRQWKMRATVFLPTAYISYPRQSFAGRDCMSWQEARVLSAQGIELGSHTVSHAKLWTLTTEELNRELRESRDQLEQRLGVRVTSFSHPYAFPQADRAYRWRLLNALHAAGYRHGVTTQIGMAKASDHPLLLPRLPVNDFDDLPLFAAKLRGAYNWVGRAQWMSKAISARLRHA